MQCGNNKDDDGNKLFSGMDFLKQKIPIIKRLGDRVSLGLALRIRFQLPIKGKGALLQSLRVEQWKIFL